MESNRPTDLGEPHPEQASDQALASQQTADTFTPAGVSKGAEPTRIASGPGGTDVSSRVTDAQRGQFPQASEKAWDELTTDEKMDRLMQFVAAGVPVATPTPTPASVPPAVQATVAPLAAAPGNPSTLAAGPQAMPSGARFDPFTGEPIANATTAGGGIHPAAAMVDALEGWADMELEQKVELIGQNLRFLIERLRVP